MRLNKAGVSGLGMLADSEAMGYVVVISKPDNLNIHIICTYCQDNVKAQFHVLKENNIILY